MKELIKLIVVALVLIAMVFLVEKAVSYGLTKEDKAQCQKLKSQSQEFPLFWLTQNEKEMCDSLGITIDAQIGNPYDKENVSSSLVLPRSSDSSALSTPY